MVGAFALHSRDAADELQRVLSGRERWHTPPREENVGAGIRPDKVRSRRGPRHILRRASRGAPPEEIVRLRLQAGIFWRRRIRPHAAVREQDAQLKRHQRAEQGPEARSHVDVYHAR